MERVVPCLVQLENFVVITLGCYDYGGSIIVSVELPLQFSCM